MGRVVAFQNSFHRELSSDGQTFWEEEVVLWELLWEEKELSDF